MIKREDREDWLKQYATKTSRLEAIRVWSMMEEAGLAERVEQPRGFYWIILQRGDFPQPAYWSGSNWQRIGVESIYLNVYAIGPGLPTPPAEEFIND